MNFVQAIKDSIEVIKLDKKKIKNLAKAKDWRSATIIMIIGGILGSYGSKTIDPNTTSNDILFSPVNAIIGAVVAVGLMLLFLKIFKGKVKFVELYTLFGYASIITWLGILALIPSFANMVGYIQFIWFAVVLVVIVHVLADLSTRKSIIVISLLFLLLIGFLASLLTIATILGGPEAISSLT